MQKCRQGQMRSLQFAHHIVEGPTGHPTVSQTAEVQCTHLCTPQRPGGRGEEGARARDPPRVSGDRTPTSTLRHAPWPIAIRVTRRSLGLGCIASCIVLRRCSLQWSGDTILCHTPKGYGWTHHLLCMARARALPLLVDDSMHPPAHPPPPRLA